MPREIECPHCGALVRAGRAACPECGSDAATGWRSSEDIELESVEIPDFWEEPAPTSPRRHIVAWIAVALALLAALALAL